MRPHEAAPPPPEDFQKYLEIREMLRGSQVLMMDPKEAREVREVRENRERDGATDRERDRGERVSNTREKRNSKPEVPVVPLVDHRSGEEKQRPRSSQDLKHPRVLTTVIVPLLSEVNDFHSKKVTNMHYRLLTFHHFFYLS